MHTLLLLLITFAFISIVVGLMTVGLWFKRKPIAGTCGGLANMQGESCEICGGNPEACEADPATPPNANELN